MLPLFARVRPWLDFFSWMSWRPNVLIFWSPGVPLLHLCVI